MKKYDNATEERIRSMEEVLWNDWYAADPSEEFIRRMAIEILGLEPLEGTKA